MSRLRRNLANAALFQLGWLACVLGAQRPVWLLLALVCLALHLLWISHDRHEWRLIISVTLLGSMLDSGLLQLGLFDFHSPNPLLPLWLVLLWALFATTLNHSLAWTARPWWRAALLGTLFGPLAYLGGARLAGIGLPLGNLSTLMLLATLWAGVLPLCQHLAARHAQR